MLMLKWCNKVYFTSHKTIKKKKNQNQNDKGIPLRASNPTKSKKGMKCKEKESELTRKERQKRAI